MTTSSELIIAESVGAQMGDAFGRGMKIDRQEVVSMVLSLDDWFSMNHEDRVEESERKIATIRAALAGIPGVEASAVPHESYLITRLQVRIGPDASKAARHVLDELDAGSPRIRVGVDPDDEGVLFVVPHTLSEGEDAIVGDRLRAVLTS